LKLELGEIDVGGNLLQRHYPIPAPESSRPIL